MTKSHAQIQVISALSVVTIWAVAHYIFRGTLIYHDSWKHIFPTIYGIALNGTCGSFPYWLTSPDTGLETVVVALNGSLTHPFRALLIAIWSCIRPEPYDAMMSYEFQIFALYLGFAFGMFVLARIIFRHWLTPVYVLAAALFSGLALQIAHSDQYAMIVFWMPWCAAAGALAHRRAGTVAGAFYINVAALFFCNALNDQEPHSAALSAGSAILIYCIICFSKARAFATRWIHLWPTALLLCVCMGGFYIIKERIFEYLTSQHTQLLPDPSTMGETGFVQPGTFLATLFPLSFTATAEEIRQGLFWRAYNFELDVLIFYVGTLPLLLLLSLFPRGGFRGAPLGWAIFSLFMLLVSMQKTYLFYALFHLPYFYLFRNYFFYFVYAIVGFLILSGYGFDRLMTVSRDDRRSILSSTLRIATPLFAFGALAIAVQKVPGHDFSRAILPWWLDTNHADIGIVVLTFVAVASALWVASGCSLNWRVAGHTTAPPDPDWRRIGGAAFVCIAATIVLTMALQNSGLLNYWKLLTGDMILVAAAFGVIGWAMRHATFRAFQGMAVIAVLVVTQLIYLVGVYKLVGEPARNIFDRYEMNAQLLAPYSATELAKPESLYRVPCPTHAACFLAQRDAASLRRDIDGTFLRHKLNPVFQDELSPETRATLLTQPTLWASAGLRSLPSLSALNALVSANKGDLPAFLRAQTYVIGAPADLDERMGSADITFDEWHHSANQISFRYRALARGIVNLAIANSPYWSATIDGIPTKIIAGNYNTISIQVDPGVGRIALHYGDPLSRAYFWSRWLMGLFGIAAVLYLAWVSRCDSRRLSPSRPGSAGS
jgi:hypothetical protein